MVHFREEKIMADNEIIKTVLIIAIILFVLLNKSSEALESVKFLLFENMLLVFVILIIFLIWRIKK